jgi:hypothetical protein
MFIREFAAPFVAASAALSLILDATSESDNAPS